MNSYLFPILLSKAVFLVFFLYAAYTSFKMREEADQPATLAFFTFSAFAVHILIQYLFLFILGDSGMPSDESMPLHHTVLMFVAIILDILIFVGIFRWRGQEGATYRPAVVWTGLGLIPFVLQFILPLVVVRMLSTTDTSSLSHFYLITVISLVLGLAKYFCFLKAIFIGRGYREEREEREEDLPATGMFEREDYIPYLCGAFLLGGFVLIPLIWGAFWDMNYPQAVFSSLISCGIFAFAHDKRGNFLFGRFIAANALVIISIMRAAVSSKGNIKNPVFIAGGLLGYLVMFACGWAGIWAARYFRRLVT